MVDTIHRHVLTDDGQWHLFQTIGARDFVHAAQDRDGALDRVDLWLAVGDQGMGNAWWRIYHTGDAMPIGGAVQWVATVVPAPFVPQSVCHVLRSTVAPSKPPVKKV